MEWWKQIEPKNRVKVPVDKLSFDFQNPRFTPEKLPENNSDPAIIAQLAASADLGELIQSMSASGYIDIEPLVAIGRGKDLVVLEGNRRLAALKVLLDPELAKDAKVTAPDLPKEISDTFKEVSVYRVESEEEARDLIGFKHINGPKAWDAYAKGIFAAKWLDLERQKRDKGEKGLTLADISHRMGDKHDTIHRIVTAVYVLDQAQAERLFNVDDRMTKNFSFSHLYTALTYTEYRDFIGMPLQDRGADPVRNPVPKEKFSALSTLLRWLYGSRSEETQPEIKRQNPDVARLKRVLGDARARRVMLERNNLDEASDSTVSASERFEKNIVDAEASLKGAQAALDGYDGKDLTLYEIAESARTKAGLICRHMDAIIKENADHKK